MAFHAPVAPILLDGRHTRLEPLTLDHLDPLWDVARETEIWRWMGVVVERPGDLKRYIKAALEARDAGTALPFATIDRASGRVAGSTRFGSLRPEHRCAEIGWTWLGKEFRRTGVNTEAKLLMLSHAFDTWGCIRLELKTDALNDRSRAAIRRIGAVEEGTFRQHMVTETGRLRDTTYYSILDSEWPAVRKRLESMLERPAVSD